MKMTRAFRDGVHRVNSAPAVLVGVFVVTLLLALPLAFTLRGMLRAHLGDSLASETAATGVNQDWWEEFSGQASGLGATFSPSIIGFGAVLGNVSGFLDRAAQPTAIKGALITSWLVWTFLIGGVLDRYARNRPTRAHGFFAACGTFFFRFLRLALVAGIVYYALFAYVHGWLFDSLYPKLTRDLTVERTAFLWRFALYLGFGALVGACSMVFDYAKVRAVVEDRRSMIGAVLAGTRFVRRHAAATFGLFLLNGLLFVLVVSVYAAAAPGAGGTGWSMWLGVAIGQAYLLARLWTKLIFYASATALFQGRLAHAGYTASPQPVWPESPAAEAIGNARDSGAWV